MTKNNFRISFENIFVQLHYNKFQNRTDCIYNDKLEQLSNEYHKCNNRNTDLNGNTNYINLHNKGLCTNGSFSSIASIPTTSNPGALITALTHSCKTL